MGGNELEWLSVSSVAKRFNQGRYDSTLRMLKRLDDEAHERMGYRFLRNTAMGGTRPSYVITLQSLRAVVPEWFREAVDVPVDRMVALERENRELTLKVHDLTVVVNALVSEMRRAA